MVSKGAKQMNGRGWNWLSRGLLLGFSLLGLACATGHGPHGGYDPVGRERQPGEDRAIRLSQ